MVKTETLSISTGGNGEIHDITADVAGRIRAAKLKNGTATVFVPGATGAVTTIEHESGLLRDMKELLDRLIPPGK
ncbi:MAG: YjbQ family protein, partial [bacterium]